MQTVRPSIHSVAMISHEGQHVASADGFDYQIRLKEANSWKKTIVLYSPLPPLRHHKAMDWLPLLAEQTGEDPKKLGKALLLAAQNMESQQWLEFEGLPDE